MPDVTVVSFFGSRGDTFGETEMWWTKSGTSADYGGDTSFEGRSLARRYMRATFAFGRGMACGGATTAFSSGTQFVPVTTCVFYQCWEEFDVDWYSYTYDYYDSGEGLSNEDKLHEVGYVLMQDLPDKIVWQGDNVIRQHHRDIYWWHTGGLSKLHESHE